MADLTAASNLCVSSAQTLESPDNLTLTTEPAVSGQAGSASQIASDWAALVRKLQASVRSRLPDPQALMALYGQLETHFSAAVPAEAVEEVVEVDSIMDEGDMLAGDGEETEVDAVASAEAIRAEVCCQHRGIRALLKGLDRRVWGVDPVLYGCGIRAGRSSLHQNSSTTCLYHYRIKRRCEVSIVIVSHQSQQLYIHRGNGHHPIVHMLLIDVAILTEFTDCHSPGGG